jgi:hypothetical protein
MIPFGTTVPNLIILILFLVRSAGSLCAPERVECAVGLLLRLFLLLPPSLPRLRPQRL